ncbi:MAG: ABC transporter ATP-binding protein [Phycisphaerae bacterium]
MIHAVNIQGLVKRYGDVTALAGLDLRVPVGSIFGFLGPNGAGKTTTLRILVGLLRATQGRAHVLSRDAWTDRVDVCAHVGYLSGEVHFHDWMTGADFLRFSDQARGGGAKEEIARLQRQFDLELHRRIRDYSRGMKQKLGLIQAMMHQPELLILDEPTTALDPLIQHVLYEELRAAAAAGRTILFSSHTLSEVELLCDRVAIIRSGRLIEESTIDALRGRALRRVTFRLKADHSPVENPPEGLEILSTRDGTRSATWQGPVDRLLPWLTASGVEDLIIGPPDLEDLFARYYREDSTASDETQGAKGTKTPVRDDDD